MTKAELAELLEKHIQRCRDAAAECPKWSPAQAEWSRARDALLNFRDDYRARAKQEGEEEAYARREIAEACKPTGEDTRRH